jgi:hypothetical protein
MHFIKKGLSKMQVIRVIVIFIGLCFLIVGAALIWGLVTPWYTSFLLGSTLLAYALATLWIGVVQSYRALVGGGLSLVLTFGGCAIHALQLGQMWYGQTFLYLAIISLWIFFFGLTLPRKKEELLPPSARWLFGIVMTLALLVGIYLIIPLPFRFAWLLRPEQSIIYGWMLIGGSLFFGWSLLKPTWENGYPVLYALLGYDLLLIGPALRLIRQPAPVTVIPFYLGALIIVVLGTGTWTTIVLCKRFFGR